MNNKIKTFIWLMVLVILVGSYLHIPNNVIQFVNNLIVSAIIGVISSGVAGSIVEKFGGDFLKNIFINIKILGIEFSVSIFIIVTAVVKWLIFK